LLFYFILFTVNTSGMPQYGGMQQPYGASHPPPDYSPFGASGQHTAMGSNPAYPPPAAAYGHATGGMVATSHMAPPPPYAEKMKL
jgi:hypothetical protein